MLELDTPNRPSETAARRPASLELLNGPEARGAPESAADTAPALNDSVPEEPATPKPEKSKAKAKKAESGTKPRRREKGRIEYKGHVGREEVAAYFDQIVAGLEKGTIRLETGKRELVISPGASCEVEIRARRKGKKEHIKFDISWRTEEKAD